MAKHSRRIHPISSGFAYIKAAGVAILSLGDKVRSGLKQFRSGRR